MEQYNTIRIHFCEILKEKIKTTKRGESFCDKIKFMIQQNSNVKVSKSNLKINNSNKRNSKPKSETNTIPHEVYFSIWNVIPGKKKKSPFDVT